MNNFLENLERVRNAKKVSKIEIAEHIGIAKSSFSSWYSRDSIPDIITADKIAKYLNVSLYDLLGIENPDAKNLVKLTDEERIFLNSYNKLNPAGKSLAEFYIKSLYNQGYKHNDQMELFAAEDVTPYCDQ